MSGTQSWSGFPRLHRLLPVLTVALLLLPAAPALAQVQGTEDPPASQGPSGTGGNTPNAGRTGGGTESPRMGNDSGASGKVMATVGVAFVIVALAVAARTRGRQKAADEVLTER